MLAISLEPEEYITIGGDVVVKVAKMARGRCFLAIEADRSIPILRGSVLERNGTPPPSCLTEPTPRKKPRYRQGAEVRWDGEREKAVKILEKIAARLEERGDGEEARDIRAQIDRLVPESWEGARSAK